MTILRRLIIASVLAASTVSLSSCAAIPIFEAQQSKSADAAAKANVMNAKVAIVTALVDTGTLPAIDELSDYGYTPIDGVTSLSFSGSGEQFCVEAVSSTGKTFHATDSETATEGSCS